MLNCRVESSIFPISTPRSIQSELNRHRASGKKCPKWTNSGRIVKKGRWRQKSDGRKRISGSAIECPGDFFFKKSEFSNYHIYLFNFPTTSVSIGLWTIYVPESLWIQPRLPWIWIRIPVRNCPRLRRYGWPIITSVPWGRVCIGGGGCILRNWSTSWPEAWVRPLWISWELDCVLIWTTIWHSVSLRTHLRMLEWNSGAPATPGPPPATVTLCPGPRAIPEPREVLNGWISSRTTLTSSSRALWWDCRKWGRWSLDQGPEGGFRWVWLGHWGLVDRIVRRLFHSW